METSDDNLSIISRWMKDVLLAFVFLTRLPVRLSENKVSQRLADVIWAFPLVGVCVGALASLPMCIGFELGLHPFACGLIAVAAQALITGALHEDGLADVADGFGGLRFAKTLDVHNKNVRLYHQVERQNPKGSKP